MRRARCWLAASSTLLLVVGCGSVPGPVATSEHSAPQRIVSLSPSATETLWAIGAGPQVIAVDKQSNHPDDVPMQTDLSGYEPNVEAIVRYQPDLVVTADAPGYLVSGLKAAGIELLSLPAPATLDNAYAQIEQIGAATGHGADAAETVAQMRRQISAALDSAPRTHLSYYHELDPMLFSVTGASFTGQLYSLFGLTNIADGTGDDAYPELSEEFVVTADPDLIFLADVQCCGASRTSVADRAGWADVSAVRNGHIYELDADVASRWGPRIVDMVQKIAAVISEVHPVPAHR
ncbi:ABC transporter substrate-binding protein [Mycobacterium sp. GA-1841]|uniref:ABC transporter substrate-binding protein n=1 Tax=Mycobacterium sp. GA-1841 TaxID=1834154 RepID=UPI0020C97BA6|nr:ABC transporter substrate-binding protein [Mycobacterium sp. GA-1841]